MSQKAWESAMGMGSYISSPAAADDRREGIKLGGTVYWNVEPELKKAVITNIRIDDDGDPWFTLTFDDDHKDVEVERSELRSVSFVENPRPSY